VAGWAKYPAAGGPLEGPRSPARGPNPEARLVASGFGPRAPGARQGARNPKPGFGLRASGQGPPTPGKGTRSPAKGLPAPHVRLVGGLPAPKPLLQEVWCPEVCDRDPLYCLPDRFVFRCLRHSADWHLVFLFQFWTWGAPAHKPSREGGASASMPVRPRTKILSSRNILDLCSVSWGTLAPRRPGLGGRRPPGPLLHRVRGASGSILGGGGRDPPAYENQFLIPAILQLRPCHSGTAARSAPFAAVHCSL
jgi:hypothetical protein